MSTSNGFRLKEELARRHWRNLPLPFRWIAKESRCILPVETQELAIKCFGSVAAVERQTIHRVINLASGEEALFSPLRAGRPNPGSSGDLLQQVDRGKTQCSDACVFRNPILTTPAEVGANGNAFRIEGKRCITASNMAKIDARHALLIFNQHDPLAFAEEDIVDYFDVAGRWFRTAAAGTPPAWPFAFWNCRWRAGASQDHGHWQLFVSTDRPYPKVARMEAVARRYRDRTDRSYWDQVWQIHEELGLGLETRGVRVFASLTPMRDKDVVIQSQAFDATLARVVYRVLDALRTGDERIGRSESWNLGIVLPPVGALRQGSRRRWHEFPVTIRVIDRGRSSVLPSDLSGLFVFGVIDGVSTDPFDVAGLLRTTLQS